MTITYRSVKGAPLTHSELDGNFTDLDGRVDGKQATLVSGTNIKTVNGNSLLGSGDVTVGGASAWGDLTGTLSNQTDLQSALDAKQDDLVSGTNIKTINGSSILGSGDLTVSGGGGVTSLTHTVSFSGSLLTAANAFRWYPPSNVTINNVYFSLGTAGSSTVRADVHKNGTTIFSTSSQADQYLVSLLNFNGTNGSTTFTDSASSPWTWTARSGTALNTTTKYFGTASLDGGFGMYSDNTWNIGTGDFTIEFWMYMYNAVDNYVFDTSRGGGTRIYMLNNAGGSTFAASVGGASLSWNKPSMNAWHHYALVRSSGNVSMFQDGVLVAGPTAGASAINILGMDFSSYLNGSYAMKAYYDDLRFSSIARYTSAFALPTSEFSPNITAADGPSAAAGAYVSDRKAPAVTSLTTSDYLRFYVPNHGGASDMQLNVVYTPTA